MEFKVEIVAIDFIKPSSPNPNHPKFHKFSLIDQLIPAENIPVVLYYSAAVVQDRSLISQRLKKSLSTALNHFYPFVGRINASDGWVDCSTNIAQGVPYKEANVAANLAEVVAKRDPNMVWPLLPAKAMFADAGTIPLQIQVSFFQCGGMSIGICASHKVVDGVALTEFLRSWSDVSLGRLHQFRTSLPDLHIIRSLLPPSDLLKPQEPTMISDPNVVTKCFVFSGKSIVALKHHAAKANNQCSRVVIVSVHLWKCMMNAVSKNSDPDGNSSSILTMYVNMRTRLDPPLPQNSFGNFVETFDIQKCYDGENMSSISLGDLTNLQKSGLKKLCNDYFKRLRVNKETLSSVVQDAFEDREKTFARQDVDLFDISSWCGFKFYEIDFGWGKPTWVSTNYDAFNNRIILIDTKEGDGIEAWVCLKKQDMAAFEQDKELLSFASFSPTSNGSIEVTRSFSFNYDTFGRNHSTMECDSPIWYCHVSKTVTYYHYCPTSSG